MKTNLSYIGSGFLIILILLSYSCEDFVEVPSPNNKLIQEDVFNNDATARSAMDGIYNQLFNAAFANGSRSSITILGGLSADNVRNINPNNFTKMQFEENELLPDNEDNLYIWASAYNVIYMTNSMLEGVNNSEELDTDLRLQLEGEARFVRAFTYFYLVNLYGDVPLVLTTSYQENQRVSRDPISEVYNHIIEDLRIAIDLLGTEYLNQERTMANKYAAISLLARVNLYLENWEEAENLSNQVISASSDYHILDDLDQVFLANSAEAIWQISPIGGGGLVTHTNEGSLFIIHPVFSFLASIELRDDFIDTFKDTDKRLSNWVGYHTDEDAYFSYKYKIWNSSEFPIEEYSLVLRLAEQYLIRAEARARQGNLAGAIEDLDSIRHRAGLIALSETHPDMGQEDLLDLIMEERRKELFAEWGHRWFDLKRTQRANQELGETKPLWENTDINYPIPAEERMKNPNLSQNDGY